MKTQSWEGECNAPIWLSSRTKWKRQTAVGLELLAEAGNYSALQRMFPSPYFYPQSLVSNLDPGAALYLYRGPSAPPPALQRPLVPRILLHGLQGGSEPPPLPSLSGVLSRPGQQRWAGRYRFNKALLGSSGLPVWARGKRGDQCRPNGEVKTPGRVRGLILWPLSGYIFYFFILL